MICLSRQSDDAHSMWRLSRRGLTKYSRQRCSNVLPNMHHFPTFTFSKNLNLLSVISSARLRKTMRYQSCLNERLREGLADKRASRTGMLPPAENTNYDIALTQAIFLLLYR